MIGTADCPSWCTRDHELEEHDGVCRATGGHPDTCIFPTAKFGQEDQPLIHVMLGDSAPGSFSKKFTPSEARDLLGVLEEPEAAEVVRAALRRVLSEVS